jgi:glycosyltransferase involved in cell wall biosynthesis
VRAAELRCLWLSGDVPYPAVSGRRVYTAGLTEVLRRHGVDVFALGIDPGVIDATTAGWSPVGPWIESSRLRQLGSRWPSMAVNCRTPAYRRALAGALRQQVWDCAVIDHLQMVWVLPELRAACVPIVYISHNHESSTRSTLARHASWGTALKMPLVYDAWRVRAAERLLVEHSSLVTTVTEADAELFRADGANRVLVLPPGHPRATRRDRVLSRGGRVAIMLTNLEWHVKRSNLMEFLSVGDEILAAAGIELRIVGPATREFLAKQEGAWRATRFVGAVERLDDELAPASVGVVYEPEGGGFKLKTLDYVFHGVAMAVLDGSMEGLPLRRHIDYAAASTAADLAREVVRLMDVPYESARMAASAIDRCADQFDWSSRGVSLADALRELVVKAPATAA